MNSLPGIARRARVVYELGRLKTASGIAPVSVLAAALGIHEAAGRQGAWLFATALVAGTITLRWRSRSGVEGVRAGLQGGIPLFLVGVGLCRIGCPVFGPISIYGAMCVGLGALAGGWIGTRTTAVGDHVSERTAAAIATATAVMGLGCVALGLANVGGMALGIVASTTAIVGVRRLAY